MSDRVKNNRASVSPVVRCGALALEPRILLDAAMVDTFVDSVEDGADNPDDAQQTLDEQQDSTETSGGDELVFVDSQIDNLDEFLGDIDLSTYDVHVVEEGTDGMVQVANVVQDYDNLSAVHIVSHGTDGSFRLGGQVFDSATLANYTDILGALGESLAEDGDLLLYGCDIAESEDGRAFVDTLADATGADVAASEDIFGAGGDHDLEYTTGEVEADVMPSLFDYQGDLTLEGVPVNDVDGSSGSDELGWAMDADGPFVIAGGNNNGEASIYRVQGADTPIEYSLEEQHPGTPDASFGFGVAISGNTAVVAEPGTDSLYIYQATGSDPENPGDPITDGLWQYKNTLSGFGGFNPLTSISEGDLSLNVGAGGYLAIDGNHILVGDPSWDQWGATNVGRVHWLADTSSDGDWSSVNNGTFTVPDYYRDTIEDTSGAFSSANGHEIGPRFGLSVGLDRGVAVVGAPIAIADDSGDYDSTAAQGRAWTYDWTPGSTSGPQWFQHSGNTDDGDQSDYDWDSLNGEADMDANGLDSDGANFANGSEEGEDAMGSQGSFFGASTDVEFRDGRYNILVGAPGNTSEFETDTDNGQAYIYQSVDATLNTLQVPGNLEDSTSTDALYGASLSLSEGRILVGAYQANGGDPSVFFYEQTDNDWSVLSGYEGDPASFGSVNELTFTENGLGRDADSEMGFQVAFTRGNVGLVASPLNDANGLTDNGTVDFLVMRTPEAVDDLDFGSLTEDDGETNLGDVTTNDVNQGETLADGATVNIESFTGEGTISLNNSGELVYDPGDNYDYLSYGDSVNLQATYEYTSAAGDFSSTARITFTVEGVNDKPVVQPPGLPDFTAPQSQDGTPVTDADVPLELNEDAFFDIDQNDSLTYSIADDGGASWLTLQESGGVWNFSYDLTGVTPETSYDVVIEASDGNSANPGPDGYTATDTFTFNVDRANESPQIGDTLGNQVATEDSIFEFATDGTSPDGFTDPDNPDESLSYEITSGPEFLNINPDTGVISGVPTNDDVTNWDGGSIADHSVTVEVTDRYPQFSQPVSQTFDLQVDNVNDAPFVSDPIGQRVATVGETFNFDLNDGEGGHDDDIYFQDVDPTNDNLSYTAELIDDSGNVIRTLDGTTGSTGGPGDWLTFDAGNQSFGGDPNDALGTILDVRLTATDDAANPKSTEHEFEIGVFPPDGDGGRVDEGGATDRHMGDAVAIADGNGWRAYGAPGTAAGGGEVSIYDSNNNLLDTINGDTASETDAFGSSVALSNDGTRLVVGAPGEGASRNGSFYVFDWDAGNSVFNQVHKFTGGAENRVGASVAISGDGNDVFVGIPHNDNDGLNAGRVRQWDMGSSSWTGNWYPQADANGSTDGDMFGRNIAYDEGILVVGTGNDDLDGAVDAGSVTVIDTGTGQQVKLDLGLDAEAEDRLGGSVDIDVFTNSSGGTSALITAGAQGDDTQARDAGAVYVYRSDDLSDMNNFTLQDVVTAYDGGPDHRFGASVAVDVMNDNEADGVRMLAGGDLNASNDGAVYAHRYWGESWGWIGQRYLADTGGLAGDSAGSQYGWSVALAGQEVATGSPSLDYGSFTDAGASYYFDLSNPESLIEVNPDNPENYASAETGENAETRNASGEKTATEDFAVPEQQGQQVARAGSGDEAGVSGSPAGEATLGRGQEVGEAQAGEALADAGAGGAGAAGADSLDRQIDRAADEFDRAAREWSALADDIVA